jgi:hypothetical protein
MSWEPGIQARVNPENVNEQLAKIEGFMEEKDAKFWLYKFFRANPAIAAYHLMGVQLLPFQQLLIKGMMQNDYTLAILSRSGGKTWLTGVFVGLYALLNPGIHIGIISATFRQSKEVMKKLITISKSPKAKFLAECMKLSQAPDEWNIEIGTSKITALPLGDGQRLRGFRFQMMVIDELLLMPQMVIDEVITPFLAGVTNPYERKKVKELEDRLIAKGLMKEEERKQWQANKMIGLSSASYKFEYLYRLYESYRKSILGEDDDNREDDEDKKSFLEARKFIAHISYDALPKELFDDKIVKKSKSEMSTSQFDREYNALFTADSAGYFKISELKACKYECGDGEHVELVGEKGAKYILAVDPSSAGNEDSDDFAMQVFKLNKEDSNATLVHSYAIAGQTPKDHAAYFKYLINNFNIVFIVFDNGAGGGATTTLALWNEMFADRGFEFQAIDIPFNDQTVYNDDLLEFRRQYNLSSKKICYFRDFDLRWQRWANEHLQGCINHKRIRFASTPVESQYKSQCPASIPIDDLKFFAEDEKQAKTEGRARYIELLDNASDLIDKTIEQCALIEITTTDTGQQRFVLPSNLRKQRGSSKARKDSYSAFVMGNWAVKIYNDAMKVEEQQVQSTFTPFFV